MNNKREWFLILQFAEYGLAVGTLIKKPDDWQGIWIVDFADSGTLWILADGETLGAMTLDNMIAAGWAIVLDYKSRGN